MRAILLGAVLLLVASGAGAQNIQGLMKDAPSNFFNDDDKRIFLDTWRKVLEETPDQQTVSWKNPKTGHGGDLTPLRSFEWRSFPCKEVRIVNQAQGRKGDNTLSSCKVDGKWKLVSSDQLKK